MSARRRRARAAALGAAAAATVSPSMTTSAMTNAITIRPCIAVLLPGTPRGTGLDAQCLWTNHWVDGSHAQSSEPGTWCSPPGISVQAGQDQEGAVDQAADQADHHDVRGEQLPRDADEGRAALRVHRGSVP